MTRVDKWNNTRSAVKYLILILGSFIMIFPFFWMFSTAIKSTPELATFPPALIPQNPVFRNFVDAWMSAPFTRMILNSLLIASITTIIIVFLSTMAGFAFAKYSFRGRNVLFLLLLSGLMVPAQVRLIPVFLIVRNLNLLNTYWGVIIPEMGNIFGVFLARQYMLGFPSELLDSARLDGCSEFGIYWRIVLPLSTTLMAALGIFMFMIRWNEFLWPLIVLNDASKFTIQVGLAFFKSQFFVEWNYLMAVSLLSIIPVLVVFMLLQKHFIQGIALTGLKQ